MTETNDGGPAFPVQELNGHGQQETTGFGMTLRDYFAAKALGGMLARVDLFNGDAMTNATHLEVSEAAYRYADAMLKARNA